MEGDWGLIGFLNGDLSGLVRTVLFSVVVVEEDLEVMINTPLRRVWGGFCTGWLSVLYCLLIPTFRIRGDRRCVACIRYRYH